MRHKFILRSFMIRYRLDFCRHMMGEDLDTLRTKQLVQIELQLEDALQRIRSRKVKCPLFWYQNIGFERSYIFLGLVMPLWSVWIWWKELSVGNNWIYVGLLSPTKCYFLRPNLLFFRIDLIWHWPYPPTKWSKHWPYQV